MRRQIHRFLKPSLACVNAVYSKLTRLAETVESSVLALFYRPHVSVSEATLLLLRERKVPEIDMEIGAVNTWHQDFFRSKRAIGALFVTAVLAHPSGAAESGMRQAHQAGRGDLPDSWVEENLLGQQPRVS